MATVAFTPNLQRHVACETREVPGATVREVLEHVFGEIPRLRGYVVDERGVLRKHMAIFVDGRQLEDRETLSDPVTPASELYVAQALSGGLRPCPASSSPRAKDSSSSRATARRRASRPRTSSATT